MRRTRTCRGCNHFFFFLSVTKQMLDAGQSPLTAPTFCCYSNYGLESSIMKFEDVVVAGGARVRRGRGPSLLVLRGGISTSKSTDAFYFTLPTPVSIPYF